MNLTAKNTKNRTLKLLIINQEFTVKLSDAMCLSNLDTFTLAYSLPALIAKSNFTTTLIAQFDFNGNTYDISDSAHTNIKFVNAERDYFLIDVGGTKYYVIKRLP